MKLKKLLKNIPYVEVRGSKEVEVTGICNNSALVSPGNLFIAKKGLTSDGSRFIPDAIAAGAVAVVTDIFDPFLSHIVQIIHPKPQEIEGFLAAEYYGHPSDKLFLIGITGTSGKTTTSYLTKFLLDQLHERCGLIGTIEWIVGDHYFPATATTPDVITCNKLLHEMKDNHCTTAIMEVSSHALEQGRVQGLDYDIAVFTNLSQDHLDYHSTMQEYAEAKQKLFTPLSPEATAIVNRDSPWASSMVAATEAEVLTYGMDAASDLQAKCVAATTGGTHFSVAHQGKEVPFFTKLIGRHNVYNCLVSIAIALCKGYSLEVLPPILERFTQVPGRLEKVDNPKNLHIFVDYSHKEDALRNVLHTLKGLTKGKLVCLFGCGGNRDKGKRPKMGLAAEELSDLVVVTTDNPRNEDPQAIIHEILQGMQHPEKALVEVDRRRAIELAIRDLSQEDVLLIAGKGHETYQIFSDRTVQFDDRLVARAFCK